MKYTSRQTLLLAGVAVAALSGSALAQEGNFGYIGQRDDSNFAYLSQQAAADGGNAAFIYQHGEQNVFLPTTSLGGAADAQVGSNFLGVEQLGARNFVGGEFLQSGSNIGAIAQFGSENVVGKFTQDGASRANPGYNPDSPVQVLGAGPLSDQARQQLTEEERRQLTL